MTSILKKVAITLTLLTSLQPSILAKGLESRIQESKVEESKVKESKVKEIASKTINHPATLTIPKPNGTLYVIRGKDLIKHRNPKKKNYGIVLKLIEYKDNGKPGYSFADRIELVAELNYLQPPDKNGYVDTFESKDISIRIGVGYKGTNSIEACFDRIVSSPFDVLRKDRRDQVKTIIDHAIRELNPKLYRK